MNIDELIYIAGTFTILVICYLLIRVVIDFVFDYYYDKGKTFLFTIFEFGIIVVDNSNTNILGNVRKLRKDDNAGFSFRNKTYFINAPKWFNRTIWNIGGIKG